MLLPLIYAFFQQHISEKQGKTVSEVRLTPRKPENTLLLLLFGVSATIRADHK
jgi:hypothetical protein